MRLIWSLHLQPLSMILVRLHWLPRARTHDHGVPSIVLSCSGVEPRTMLIDSVLSKQTPDELFNHTRTLFVFDAHFPAYEGDSGYQTYACIHRTRPVVIVYPTNTNV